MKKTLRILAVLPFVFFGCSDDDEATPPHEVGEWGLDSFLLTDFPAGFESNEGLIADVDQITFGGLTLEDYELTLNNDGTFTRSIDVAGPNINDDGTWVLDDDELVLTVEDQDDQSFDVDRNEENDLWLAESATFGFIPDIYFDTVTQSYIDYLNTLTETQLDSVNNVLTQAVVIDLVYVFERE